ncbi:MAG: hypothetical protein AAF957_19735 [Planctomycetota bacterium]
MGDAEAGGALALAEIVEIEESFPLGIRVRIRGELDDAFLTLAEDCIVEDHSDGKHGTPCAPGDLHVGDTVRLGISGRTVTAVAIEGRSG